MTTDQAPEPPARTHALAIPEELVAKWQRLVDLLAETVGVPAALIMRAGEEEIEVFRASQGEDNPYTPGDKEHLWGSGLYCETVIREREELLIPDAPADPDWQDNPDVKLGMISYLGLPLTYPDGRYFGTICVLDRKPNAYTAKARELLESFRDLVEGHLALLLMNHELGERNRAFEDYIAEIRTLRGLHPVCSHCQKIHNERGQWEGMTSYLARRYEADFTHTVCPECLRRHYPDAARRLGF
jgi:GAF domain-containing protein